MDLPRLKRVAPELVIRIIKNGVVAGSTRTTEAFYARIRADDACHEIEKAFSQPRLRVETPS